MLSLGGTLHAIIGLRPSTSVVEGAGRLACGACGYALHDGVPERCSECGASLSERGSVRETRGVRIRSWPTIGWSLLISMLVIVALLALGIRFLSLSTDTTLPRASSLSRFADDALAVAITGGRSDLPPGATGATVAEELASRAQRGTLSYEAMRLLMSDIGIEGGFASRCRQAYAMQGTPAAVAASATAGPVGALDHAEAAALRALVGSFPMAADLPSSSLSRFFEHLLELELTVLDMGDGRGLVVVAPRDEYRAPTQRLVRVHPLGGEWTAKGSGVLRPLQGWSSRVGLRGRNGLVVCCAGIVPLAELGIDGSALPLGRRAAITVDGALRVDCEVAAASIAPMASSIRVRLAPREIWFARLEEFGDRDALTAKIRSAFEGSTIDPESGIITLPEGSEGADPTRPTNEPGVGFIRGMATALSLSEVEIGFLSPELALVVDDARHPIHSAMSRHSSLDQSWFVLGRRRITTTHWKLREGQRAEIELSLVEDLKDRGAGAPSQVGQLTEFLQRYGVTAAFGGQVPASFAPAGAGTVPKIRLLHPPFSVRVPLHRRESRK